MCACGHASTKGWHVAQGDTLCVAGLSTAVHAPGLQGDAWMHGDAARTQGSVLVQQGCDRWIPRAAARTEDSFQHISNAEGAHRTAARSKENTQCTSTAVGACTGLQNGARTASGAQVMQWVHAQGCSSDQGQHPVQQGCSGCTHRAAAVTKDSVRCTNSTGVAHIGLQQ